MLRALCVCAGNVARKAYPCIKMPARAHTGTRYAVKRKGKMPRTNRNRIRQRRSNLWCDVAKRLERAGKVHKSYEDAKYFALSFGAAFILFSLMGLAAGFLPHGGTDTQVQTPQSGVAVDNVYLPRAEDNMTVLLAVEAKDGARRFALATLDVQAGDVTARWLPPETALSYNGKAVTLEKLYGRDGPRAAKTALAQILDEPVERWMAFTADGLVRAADTFGTVEYSPPGRGQPKDSGAPPATADKIAQELRRLDGDALCALLFAPGVSAQQAQAAVEAYLRAALQTALTEDADACFAAVVNAADTDVSFLDYDSRREALRFMAGLNR